MDDELEGSLAVEALTWSMYIGWLAVLVGAALAGGMLVANLLRPPRGSL